MIDAVGVVRAWGNAQTSVSGAGQPVALGFLERRLRSPGRGAYALVDAVFDDQSTVGLDAEGLTSHWRLTIRILSATDAETAERGARALADALRQISATRPTAAGAQLLMATGIIITNEPIDDEPAFTVQADLYLS